MEGWVLSSRLLALVGLILTTTQAGLSRALLMTGSGIAGGEEGCCSPFVPPTLQPRRCPQLSGARLDAQPTPSYRPITAVIHPEVLFGQDRLYQDQRDEGDPS